jgi:hypothetical protein
MTEILCRACGASNRPQARFCRGCGVRLRRMTGMGETVAVILLLVFSSATLASAIPGAALGHDSSTGSQWLLAAQFGATLTAILVFGILFRKRASRLARIVIVIALLFAWTATGWLTSAIAHDWARTVNNRDSLARQRDRLLRKYEEKLREMGVDPSDSGRW